MKIAVMQPYFFPYMGYWKLIYSVDKFIIFDDVNYINKGYINRNKIINREKEKFITLKIKNRSQNKKINELELFDNNINIFNDIKQSYIKSKNFNKYKDVIYSMICNEEKLLSLYLKKQIEAMVEILKIKTEILISSDYNLGVLGKNKIYELCTYFKADEYINPIGGSNLYDPIKFEEKGIKLKFIQSKELKYKQNSKIFIENTSVIDFIMNVDENEFEEYLKFYKVK